MAASPTILDAITEEIADLKRCRMARARLPIERMLVVR